MWQFLLADSGKTFWLPERASTYAPGADDIFNVIMWICIFFFALVTILLVAFVIRFRHRPGVKRDTSAGHNNTLEITWTLIPTIIVVFLYYYGFKHYMRLAVEPPNAYEITATGKMWQWSFTYPNGYEDSELHVPVNLATRVILQSNDVIHSLSIPAFRVKKDVVPGRFNRLWFQATEGAAISYVSTLNVNGAPYVIAVDCDGQPLRQAQNKFGTLSPEAQGLLGAQLANPKIDPAKPFETVTLLRGVNIFLSGSGSAGSPAGGLLAEDGSAARGSIELGAVPAEIRNALRAQAPSGTIIPDTQPVSMFDDAKPFEIYCAAYCGTNHSIMHSRVIVHSTRADFDKWLDAATKLADKGTPAEKGKRLYLNQGCAGCHSIDGTRVTGPTWKDLFGSQQQMSDGSKPTVDEDFVREFVRNPTARVPVGYPPVMPPFQLTNPQVHNIVSFMKTISVYAPKPSLSEMEGAPTTGPTSGPATAPAVTPSETKLK